MEPINKGVLPDPRPLEEKLLTYVAGTETSLITKERTSDWSLYYTKGIPQSLPGVFDSMSCISYADCQTLEEQLNFDLPTLPQTHKDFLNIHGYIQDGKILFSKRFLAIASGTTPQGNYFFKVHETCRKVGMLPESMLSDSLEGIKSTEEYLSYQITPEMYAVALEFLNYFSVSYQLINGYDEYAGFTPLEISKSKEALKSSPLNIGTPLQTNHSIVMHDITDTKYDALDHYVPFIRTNDSVNTPVHFAYQVHIDTVKAPVRPIIALQRDLKFGDHGSDVVDLQNVLKYENCFPLTVQSTGYFGEKTKAAVIKWQEKYADEILKPLGLVYSTAYVGSQSRKWLKKYYS